MIIFKRGVAASQYFGCNQTYIIQHRRTYIGKLSYQFFQNMLLIKCRKQHPLSINEFYHDYMNNVYLLHAQT